MGFISNIPRKMIKTAVAKPGFVIAPAIIGGTIAGIAAGGKGAFGTAMETITGDRNAVGTIVGAQLRRSVQDIMNTPGERNAMEYLSRDYSRVPSASLYGPGGGPSGNVVFGMYNLRAK